VVGFIWRGKMKGCVALNPSVKTSDNTDMGRVSGGVSPNADPPQNNHARNDMAMVPAPTESTLDGKDGANVEVGTGEGRYNNPGFWSGHPMQWDFALWQWPPNPGPNSLPILIGAGGAQNPTATKLPLP
jgi:hypothetical protein